MFTKFELIGIGVSVAVMAAALFVLKSDTVFFTGVNEPGSDTQTGTVYVADEENQQAALRNAIISAADPAGELARLIVDDVVIGGGPEANVGSMVTVHYTGTLQNGQEFDSSVKRGEPFTFTIGEGKVIKGWEEGIVGMKVGGKRILVIPSDLGYGDAGYGPIPGGASLVFSVELLDAK
jgi:FKBP-type peptidyl-prolyl cis-trans isomerase FkpA